MWIAPKGKFDIYFTILFGYILSTLHSPWSCHFKVGVWRCMLQIAIVLRSVWTRYLGAKKVWKMREKHNLGQTCRGNFERSNGILLISCSFFKHAIVIFSCKLEAYKRMWKPKKLIYIIFNLYTRTMIFATSLLYESGNIRKQAYFASLSPLVS